MNKKHLLSEILITTKQIDMNTSEINWNVVEEVAKSFFPDEYGTLTRNELEYLEEKISNGQNVVPDIDRGGVNNDGINPLMVVSIILQMLAMLQVWYYNEKKAQKETNWRDFHTYQEDKMKILQDIEEDIAKGVKRILEKEFESIKNKIEVLEKLLKNQGTNTSNN